MKNKLRKDWFGLIMSLMLESYGSSIQTMIIEEKEI